MSAVALVGAGLLVLEHVGTGAATGKPSQASNTTSTPHKVFVCKYVGEPGAAERLQTGNNPIDVSVAAIRENPVVIGSFFADRQGRSFVLAFDTGQPDPSVSACPIPSPKTKPPHCGDGEGKDNPKNDQDKDNPKNDQDKDNPKNKECRPASGV